MGKKYITSGSAGTFSTLNGWHNEYNNFYLSCQGLLFQTILDSSLEDNRLKHFTAVYQVSVAMHMHPPFL